MSMAGTLFLVGTPIGNLEDITLRAARVLAEVDVVAAEDTRRTLRLLNHLGCPKRLVACHEHNWREAVPRLVALLQEGKDVALCTDAGMPCISDPGWQLVDACREAGIPVTAAPGPAAVVTAAALSGLDSGRFVFEGFLPRQGKERRERLAALAGEERMVILYEAPHRLGKTLADLAALFPQRRAALCKDLTKRFERVERGALQALAEQYAGLPDRPQGEYALVLAPWQAESMPQTSQDPREALCRCRAEGVPKKDAVRQVADALALPKREVYRLAEELWD